MEKIARGGLVEVIDKNGELLTFKPKTYADLVYQTKMSEAASISTLERFDKLGVKYGKIIGSNSGNFCTAFVGKIFWLGEGVDPLGLFPSYRELPGGRFVVPPFHPRCTKRWVAVNPALLTPDEIAKGTLNAQERYVLEAAGGGATAQKRFAEKFPEKVQAANKASASRPKGKAQPARPVKPKAAPKPAPIPPSRPERDDELFIEPPTQARDAASVKVEAAIDAIRKVHTMPKGSTPAKVSMVKFKDPETQGEFLARSKGAHQIRVSRTARAPAITMAHEHGHRVAVELTGSTAGPDTDPRFADFRRAAEDSQSIILLRSIPLDQVSLETADSVRYALKPSEIFARAYAQWVAIRSRSLLDDLDARRASYWDDIDFEEIDEFLTEFFAKEGLLK